MMGRTNRKAEVQAPRLHPSGAPAPRFGARIIRGLRSGLLLAAVSLLAAGCLPWRSGEPEWDPASRPQGVLLEVDSRHFNDVVIYLLPNGQQRRLGVVGGVSSMTIDLTEHSEIFTGSFRLAAEPIGSRARYVSDPIVASHGAVVALTLGSEIRMSHWHIR